MDLFSEMGDDGVDDILSPRPRSLEDKKKTTSNYLGLNLGRSQSAAPETWEYGNSASNKSAVASMGNDGIFGRSRFFAEENEEDLIQRPASTGVIGRNEESETADVNSILETLGLASLGSTATNDQQQKSNTIPSSPYSSTVIGAHAIASPGKKKSIMEKIHESPKSTTTQGSNYFTTKEESNNVFTGVNHGATQQYPTEQNQPNILHQGGQQQQQPIQYVQQPPATHYNPQQQQQVYYHPAPPQAYYDNRGQQYTVPQQQTVYINQPAATPYGYDYHGAPQQHLQHHNGHVIMPHQGAPMHAGQTQYVSVVPIQGGPHIIGGPPGQQYAYVQYGDGMSPHHAHHAQPTLVAGAPTFVMGPNGPMIPVANSPMAINYSGHGSSPPGGTGQSPPRNSLRSPDRRKKMDGMQGMSTPRGGKRIEKSSPTPSKPLSPEASNLLDEIRASKSRNQWSIYNLKGYVMEFCLDQNGSRFIQQRLEVADPREKEAVMDEIIPQIKDLNNDVFGNYVVQKLYEFGTDSMKKGLKGTLEGNMMLLSMQMYGCRVVQKALESLDHEDLCDLLHEFDSYVLTTIQDQNGNHVMQKCIEIMSIQAREVEARSGTGVSNLMADKIQFIIDDVHANIRSLCCHPYGCRVLQRMVSTTCALRN